MDSIARPRPPRQFRMEDVARRAGVSVATVSRIINGRAANRASPTTRQRVQDVITELHYRPLRAGRALRTKQSHLVALLIPDITNAFYAAIAHSVESAISDLGYAMILCNTDENSATQDVYLEEMQSHLVSSIVLLGAVDTPGLRRAMAAGVSVIFINRRAPPGLSGPFVGIDNYGAAELVAEQFVRQKYSHCAAIHGPLFSSASQERLEGYRDYLARAGMPLEDRYVVGADLTIESGYANAVRLLDLDPRPRAIFCGNDLIAYGAHRRCRELDLRVPDDVALFGFDDNPLNEWLAPWLSTIHVPYDSFGPATAQIVRDLDRGATVEENFEILLPYRSALRASA